MPTKGSTARLTGFQKSLLVATARTGGTPNKPTNELPHGLRIKDELEPLYDDGTTPPGDDAIHHGRLYPNLTKLADNGYLRIVEIDQRTNGYQLTPDGVDALLDYYLEFVRPALTQIDDVYTDAFTP